MDRSEQIRQEWCDARDKAGITLREPLDLTPDEQPLITLISALQGFNIHSLSLLNQCRTATAREDFEWRRMLFVVWQDWLLFTLALEKKLRIYLVFWGCANSIRRIFGSTQSFGTHLDLETSLLPKPDIALFTAFKDHLEVLRQLAEDFKQCSIMRQLYETDFWAAPDTSMPMTLITFLDLYTRFPGAIKHHILDFTQASSRRIYYSQNTLQVLQSTISHIGSQAWRVNSDWTCVTIAVYADSDFARIEITSPLIMTPSAWAELPEGLRSSGLEKFLETGYIEPLAWDQGYGQGVSLYLPWVTA